MRLNFEERKKFYENDLASGEIFESNGDLFLSATATKEGMEKLKNAEFPKNSVTVLGEKNNAKLFLRFGFFMKSK